MLYNPCLKTGANVWIASHDLLFHCDAFVLPSPESGQIESTGDYYERCRQTRGRHHLLLRGPSCQLSELNRLHPGRALLHILTDNHPELVWQDTNQTIFIFRPLDWWWLAYEGRIRAQLEPGLQRLIPASPATSAIPAN